MTTTSLSDAKAHLSDYVKAAEDAHERTTITKNRETCCGPGGLRRLRVPPRDRRAAVRPRGLASIEESKISGSHGFSCTQNEVWVGQSSCSDEESEERLITRMGRQAYDAARAATRADLLAHPDANVRERAKDYE